MSKAFTKENDDEDRDELSEQEGTPLPKGQKNYMTPKGEARLRTELKELLYKKRPELTEVIRWAASNGDRSENADYIYGKRRLREMDKRIRFLAKRLENAEVIDPTKVTVDSVRFGATVEVIEESGEKKTYRIVGIDEIDVKAGKISWISPLGSALLKAKVGDSVTYRSPKGDIDVEIAALRYETID